MSWLFRKIDISTLVFFRIVLGLLGLYEIVHLMKNGTKWRALTGGEDFNFTYYGFEWVKPLPSETMYILCYFMIALSIMIIVGYSYRFCTFFYGLGYTYLYLIEKSYYLNHGYLFAILCFVMCLAPANRAFSVDARLNPSIRSQLIPYWPIFLLQFGMGVVYFYGGIAKLNPDWLRGFPLVYWLEGSAEEIPVIGHILDLDWMAVFMSYGGMLLDLTAIFFLSNKHTRKYFILAVIAFHMLNKLIFQIGIFPYLSFALSLLYFSPDWPRKLLHRVFPTFIEPVATEFVQPPSLLSELWGKRMVIGFIAVFCAYHVLFPLRHFMIKGPVDWTEEGLRYSWHMMLRTKKGKGRFTVRIPSEDRTIKISTKKYLSKRQRKKMFTHPEMILQFAHFLRDKYHKQGYKDIEVYANVKSKFNGRGYRHLVDPKVDLAAVTCCNPWKHDDWIMIRDDVYTFDHLKEKKEKPSTEKNTKTDTEGIENAADIDTESTESPDEKEKEKIEESEGEETDDSENSTNPTIESE